MILILFFICKNIMKYFLNRFFYEYIDKHYLDTQIKRILLLIFFFKEFDFEENNSSKLLTLSKCVYAFIDIIR